LKLSFIWCTLRRESEQRAHFGSVSPNLTKIFAYRGVVMKAKLVMRALWAMIIALGSLGSRPVLAQETVLHTFQGGAADGGNPYAPLISDAAGNLYGTTIDGGNTLKCHIPKEPGCGTVFELSPLSGGGWMETILYSFQGPPDGFFPEGGLTIGPDGGLYGTTDGGGNPNAGCSVNGIRGCGTVFELLPQPGGGWTETLLYSFGGGQDAILPQASVIFDAAGNLYGTTSEGGDSSFGFGTVFELSPQGGGGWAENILYSFQDNGADGGYPSSALVFDALGNLYGTTQFGGRDRCDDQGCGTVFELSPQSGGGWAETVIHSFRENGFDGKYPLAGLIADPEGNLYGTTFGGGVDRGGTVFELSPRSGGGWNQTILHAFPGHDPDKGGNVLRGSLIMDGLGNLYGTTYSGGIGRCSGGCGVVFELMPQTSGPWSEKVLHAFKNNGSDGQSPYAGLLMDVTGNLFGTTAGGGAVPTCSIYNGCGTVFEIVP